MTHEQERLVVSHMPIVPAIAKQLMKRFSLPFWIELEEMISCGYVGLCNAALNFDPERGIKFGTYAHFKVRGAIIDDFLRKQGPRGLPIPCETLGPPDDNRRPRHSWLGLQDKHANQNDEPIDASPSAEDVLIEQQEQRRKCRHIAFAGKSVGVIEFRAVTKKHMRGESLREIGAAEGRSASWAHYRVHCGERQLKEALLDPAANDA